MNKERYNQIIDEAYDNYSKEYEKDNSIGILLLVKRLDNELVYKKPDKESFIGLCKDGKLFSERWGLKIEERELSLREKCDWLNIKYPSYGLGDGWTIERLSDNEYLEEVEFEYLVPTKLITVTYNNETVEIYE